MTDDSRRCKNCKWWGDHHVTDPLHGQTELRNAKKCGSEKMFFSNRFVALGHFEGACIVDEDTFELMPSDEITVIVEDGLSTPNDLMTGPEFCCVHFERKPDAIQHQKNP
jgi:hypothetical protein